MSNENLKVVQQMYQDFADGNVENVLQAMHPEIEWNEAENFIYADGNPYFGPSAVVEGVFKRLGEDWEYWSLSTDQFLEGGDNIVVLGRYKGKHKKTGTTIDAQFAHVWWLENKKVRKFQQYTDTAQVANAVIG